MKSGRWKFVGLPTLPRRSEKLISVSKSGSSKKLLSTRKSYSLTISSIILSLRTVVDFRRLSLLPLSQFVFIPMQSGGPQEALSSGGKQLCFNAEKYSLYPTVTSWSIQYIFSISILNITHILYCATGFSCVKFSFLILHMFCARKLVSAASNIIL